MEAKDTVMNFDELLLSGIDFNKPTAIWIEQCLKKQAEISFKMGYNQALKDKKDGLSPSVMV